MKNCLLHLSLIPSIGPAAIQRIVDAVGREQLTTLYDFSSLDFVQLAISPAQAAKLVAGLSNRSLLEREIALAEKHAITVISLYDAEYPESLRHCYMPPPILYLKGALSHNKALAIVGSRKANAYAKSALESFVPSLVECGWSIVSGGALGADTFAHQATLAVQGTTYAVLGSGLLRPYPSENRKLFDAIADSGALISSFPLEFAPLPGNFPARNRIIAGLSKGCIVVQAAEQSGASITAGFARDQGKEVFVVPGRIDDPLFIGSHRLIQQGAKLVASPSDILEEFNEGDTVRERSILFSAASPLTNTIQEDPFMSLFAVPISTEELMIKSGISLELLHEKLFNLQLEGKIEQDYAGFWRRL